MKVPYAREEVEVPQGVKVDVERVGPYDYRVVVQGPLGRIEKVYRNIPVVIRVEDGRVVFEVFNARKREYAMLGLFKGLFRNLFLGVTRGWRYRVKVIYTHFPMIVKVERNNVVIENFLGRKSKIVVPIPEGVKVQVMGREDVIVEGVDRDVVSRFAWELEAATELRGEERPSPHGREGGLGVVDGLYVYAVEHVK